MSTQINIMEKITVKNTAELPEEILDAIANEITRIRNFQEDYDKIFEASINVGKGWNELSENDIRAETILRAFRENRSVSFYLDFEYTWRVFKLNMSDPGFYLRALFEKLSYEMPLDRNLSFELFILAENGYTYGNLYQIYHNENWTLFNGEAEYEEVAEIPNGKWNVFGDAIMVETDFIEGAYDPDVLNAAVKRLLSASNDDPCNFDFHNPKEQLFINYPKLETKAEREEFLAAAEEVRAASNGAICFGSVDNYIEWVDASRDGIRKLKITMDYKNGGYKFFITRPVSCSESTIIATLPC